jgi:hypothetical protein
VASAGKGLPFIGKLNEFIDRVLHPTIQKVGNSRAAIDTLNRGYFLLQTTAFIAEAGSTDSLLVLTGHPFKEGDGIRIKTSANPIKEIEIVIDEIIDANTVKFAGYLSHPLTAGDQIYGRRPITETFASDGTAIATLSYLKDAISVPVTRDTVTPSNSTALPVEIMGANGMVLNVTTGDIDVQLNHADRTVGGVPVPHDSVRIGDGAREAEVTTAKELKVNDATNSDTVVSGTITAVNASPTGVATAGSAIEVGCNGKSVVGIQVSGTFGGTLAAAYTLDGTNWIVLTGAFIRNAVTGNLQVTMNNAAAYYSVSVTGALKVRVYGLVGITGTADITLISSKGTFFVADAYAGATLSGISNKLPLTLGSKADTLSLATVNSTEDKAAIGSLTEIAPLTDTASSGLNGRLQRIAQRLSSLIGLLPTTIGIKDKDSSLSVVLATNQPSVPVSIDSTNIDIRNLTAATDVVALGGTEFKKVTDVMGTISDPKTILDTGDFTLVSMLKGGLANWISLLARIPTLGQKIVSGSISIVQASSHSFSVVIAQPTPTYQQSLVVTDGGVVTLTGPANAKACKVMTSLNNITDLKITVDGATNPSATVGFEMQPGRSEDFEGALEVRVIAKTAATAQEIYVHWRA